MTHPRDEEIDRAVSRRVDHPTDATTADAEPYAAADPGPRPDPGAAPGPTGGLPADTRSAGADGTATSTAREDDADADAEPARSE